ncbi:FKBP-type peptidyl-prolyl cis-trans isomerase [Reichenbachiella carrageenanivorans]|uniref:peptidylprolyl isomerase n=1 Tax=Reichenbachiella carrageenanivorans TaxID=2979869 RepID=A0ABY6D0P1_9BACT|nr:FKBP-type peptidyl-prolyl cis-trans isomerase [Reichenbachiella carrageenanivorans]UXX78633.1 FKBP-type peptidyl-prolyl cis-trans isomerase [Reichenbachiella carrageenanivorans]
MIFNLNRICILIGFCISLTLVGCSDDDAGSSDLLYADQEKIEAYLAENNLTATKDDSGIYYTIVTENPTGDTQANGKILSIFYSAKVMGGSGYDARVKNTHDSLLLKQGVNAVYPVGLDLGLAKMKVGETFIFYIPSTLGYGDYSFSSLIPSHAILEIEVELVAIQNESDVLAVELDAINAYIVSEDLNNTTAHPLDPVEYASSDQIYYKRQQAGTANATVKNNELVSINYVGSGLDGTEFDRRTGANIFEYTFGSGEVITGLDAGVGMMEKGESALIILPSHKAYGESVGLVIPQADKQEFVALEIIPQYATKVKPYQIVTFEVNLLNNP